MDMAYGGVIQVTVILASGQRTKLMVMVFMNGLTVIVMKANGIIV
jgi:hypothetical protein